MRILLTGGSGLLGSELQAISYRYNGVDFICPSHVDMDITDHESVCNYLDTHQVDQVLHAAALTRPMSVHETDPECSIRTNIIGTANLAICAIQRMIKMVYISTDYVYPGTKGSYRETDPVRPVNAYAVSKYAGECAVMMVPCHLILRCCFGPRPFDHDVAFIDHWVSKIYVDEIAPRILTLVCKDVSGVVNVGGNRCSVFEYAARSVPVVRPKSRFDVDVFVPYDTSMDLERMRSLDE